MSVRSLTTNYVWSLYVYRHYHKYKDHQVSEWCWSRLIMSSLYPQYSSTLCSYVSLSTNLLARLSHLLQTSLLFLWMLWSNVFGANLLYNILLLSQASVLRCILFNNCMSIPGVFYIIEAQIGYATRRPCPLRASSPRHPET